MDLITDLDRLPQWNQVVREVLERPAELAAGAEWVVRIQPPGWPSWPSRSRCLEIDRQRHVFAYRSRTDDGNPSWADWRWEIADRRGGAEVTVQYGLNPRTRVRTTLFSRLRHRRIRRVELPASIAAIGRALGTERQAASAGPGSAWISAGDR